MLTTIQLSGVKLVHWLARWSESQVATILGLLGLKGHVLHLSGNVWNLQDAFSLSFDTVVKMSKGKLSLLDAEAPQDATMFRKCNKTR